MFCPKCHTDLKKESKFCPRCGTEQNSTRKKSNWGSFSSSKTFERMNIKKTIDKEAKEIVQKQEEISLEDHNETHENQYNYSKNYSNVVQDNNKPHEVQYNYSKNYSNVTKKTDTPHEDQYNYSQQYSLMDNSTPKDEQEYEDAFIGKNAKWFKEKVSIPAAIFGPFYFMYRKMYGQAIVIFILYLVTYAYLGEELGIFTRFALNIIFALRAHEIYLKEVRTRIENIKKRNPNADSKELLELCKKAGGTCKAATIFIAAFIYFMLIVLITIQKALPEREEIVRKSEITNNEITYRIPEQANLKTNYSNYQHITDGDQDGYCFITVVSTQSNNTEEEYLSFTKSNFKEYNQSEIKNVEINQQQWKTMHFDNDYSQRDVFIMKYNGYIYDFQFDYSVINACNLDINEILKSVTIKEN